MTVSNPLPHADTILVRDIPYRNHAGVVLMARLYRPSGEGPFPAVVEVHGGAWVKNDRTKNEAIHRFLAASGILVLAVDFRMPPAAKFPAAANDVNFAIRWLKQRATEFGTRPELVGALGTSSGGHLVMLNALRPSDRRFTDQPGEAQPDAGLAFVVACWPVLDPSSRYDMATSVGRQDLIDGHHAFWASEAEMAEGNPQYMLEGDPAPTLPPLLLIQGTEDDNLPQDMAERFARAYRRRGGSVRLEMYAGEPHAFVTRDPTSDAARAALDTIRSFIRDDFFGSAHVG